MAFSFDVVLHLKKIFTILVVVSRFTSKIICENAKEITPLTKRKMKSYLLKDGERLQSNVKVYTRCLLIYNTGTPAHTFRIYINRESKLCMVIDRGNSLLYTTSLDFTDLILIAVKIYAFVIIAVRADV